MTRPVAPSHETRLRRRRPIGEPVRRRAPRGAHHHHLVAPILVLALLALAPATRADLALASVATRIGGDGPGWVVPDGHAGRGPARGTWLPWSSSPGARPAEPSIVPSEVAGGPAEAAGQLDPSFSGDGIATPNYVPAYEEANSIDAGSVVAGEANGRFQLARFLSNGSPDRTFGGDGAVQTDLSPGPDIAYDVYRQTNGRYVAVGTASGVSVAVRYLPDGRLDDSFGSHGVVGLLVGRGFNFFAAVTPGFNGDLGFVGRAGGTGGRVVIAQVDRSGRPDPTFSGDGFQLIDFSSGDDWAWDVAVTGGDYVLVGASDAAGGSMAVARVSSSGLLDPGFGNAGRRTLRPPDTVAAATSVKISDSEILVAGASSFSGGAMALAKLDASGRYVRSFGDQGWTTVDFTSAADVAWDLVVDENGDGGIVLVGRAAGGGGRIGVARLETDGLLDPSFDGDGRQTTDLSPGNDEARAVNIYRSHPEANSEVVVAGVRDGGTSRARIAMAVYLGS